MPNVETHKPGVISWIELATSDQTAAKAFYSSLMGWKAEDSPMGPEAVYTTFQLNGRKAAAAYMLMADEKAMGIPPHWNVYVAVASADDTARRAAEVGGKVLAGPFDVMEHGRMAVIQDPQGAVFCLWQAKQHQGIQVYGEAGSLCWVDVNTPDQQGAVKFYSQLFGWEFEAGDGGYLHIKAGGQFIGGVPSAEQLPPNAPPHWLIYLQVDDCDISTNRARELGGKVCFGPVSMEKVGRFSVVMDTQGAALSLFQPARRG